jgi:membrane protease YdiL (CAAX protease family)
MGDVKTNAAIPVKPLRVLGSILLGFPSAIVVAGLFGLLPWMVRYGFGLLTILNVTFAIPAALMLLSALVAYRLEGRPLKWSSFRDRMRLFRLSRNEWLWTLGLLVVGLGGELSIGPLADALDRIRWFTQPNELPAFMNSMRAGLPEVDLSGRWLVGLWLLFAIAVLNIGGEELWWRGIVLPRQELFFGRWTWLIHGVEWTLFHAPASAGTLVAYLPVTIPLSYVAQRTENTWPGMVVRLTVNVVGTLAVFRRIFS